MARWQEILSLLALAAGLSAGCNGEAPQDADAPGSPHALVRPEAPGRLIAYTRNVDGHSDIYLARSDGTHRRRLTRSPVQANGSGNGAPAWSPDGRRLAFVANRNRRVKGPAYERQFSALFTIRADGTRQRQLTRFTSDWVSDPAWSPDGRWIAFNRYSFGDEARDTDSDDTSVIAVIPARGGSERVLGSPTTYDGSPAWSPDGRWLAFARGERDESPDIWLMRPDGSDARRIAEDGASPAWSPDGRQIAFASARDRYGETIYDDGTEPNSEVYVMNADGSNQRRLTRNKADDGSPTWTPDGRSIAFDSGRPPSENFNHHVWVMRADGTCQRALLADRAWTLEPAWQPGRPPTRRRLPRC